MLLSPYFITGFSDGEGSFSLIIKENLKFKTGWGVELAFVIILHTKDGPILDSIKSSLGGIVIISKQSSRDAFRFRVGSANELGLVIEHFDKFNKWKIRWLSSFQTSFLNIFAKIAFVTGGIRKACCH